MMLSRSSRRRLHPHLRVPVRSAFIVVAWEEEKVQEATRGGDGTERWAAAATAPGGGKLRRRWESGSCGGGGFLCLETLALEEVH
jgi:hypothetical protein